MPTGGLLHVRFSFRASFARFDFNSGDFQGGSREGRSPVPVVGESLQDARSS